MRINGIYLLSIKEHFCKYFLGTWRCIFFYQKIEFEIYQWVHLFVLCLDILCPYLLMHLICFLCTGSHILNILLLVCFYSYISLHPLHFFSNLNLLCYWYMNCHMCYIYIMNSLWLVAFSIRKCSLSGLMLGV